MLRNLALCLFLINIKLMGSITCSKPSDLYTSSINPYSITVTSNNMGDACISWVETVEDNNYLRVSQKFPGLNWSKPETISPRDFCNQILNVQVEMDNYGNTYAVWKADFEETSNIYFAEKEKSQIKFNTQCLLENYSGFWELALTKDGEAHVMFNIVENKLLFFEIFSFDRGKFINKLRTTRPCFKQWYYSNLWFQSNLFVVNGNQTIHCFEYPINENESTIEYSEFKDNNWSDSNFITPISFNPTEGHYRVGDQLFVIGPPSDLALLRKPIAEGKISGTSTRAIQPNIFQKFENHEHVAQLPNITFDQHGNICLVWGIIGTKKKGIAIAVKPVNQDWLSTIEIFPEEGEYVRPHVATNHQNKFVLVWEKKNKNEECIVGAIFDLSKKELSPETRISLSNEKCCKPKLCLSNNGNGYVTWGVIGNEGNDTIQVCEIKIEDN